MMLAFGHASVGAMIGVVTLRIFPEETPLLLALSCAFIFGVISHYLTDRIPHGHYAFNAAELTKKMIVLFLLDFGGGILVLLGIALYKFGMSENFLLIFAGIIGSQLPDIFEGFVSRSIIPFKSWVKKHRHFHFVIMHAKTPPILAMSDGTRKWSKTDLWQIISFIGAIIILGSL